MAKEKEELKLEETEVKKKKGTNTKKNTENVKEEKVSISAISKSKKTTTKPKTTNSTKKVSKETSKSNNKSSDIKKASSKSKETTSTKKSTNTKTNTSKTTNSSKQEKIIEKNNNVTPNTEKGKIKEETIIEKIKSFIAKIVAMQEEAKNEELAKKEKKKNAKKAGIIDKLEDTEKPVYLTEYYDLPYRYNETVVKILAQTPKRIFVYWDVADEDIVRYENAFGKDFFEKTYPVLLVHNDDKNYTTEIPINDFANSWYIDIKDPKTKYSIQLGRKFKVVPTNIDIHKIQEQNIILKTDYLPIAQSNLLEVPNDRVLFDRMPTKITYRNVKTYEEKEKIVADIKTPYGILYNVKEFYQDNYKDEMIDEEIFNLNNPTSGGLSSSSFK